MTSYDDNDKEITSKAIWCKFLSIILMKICCDFLTYHGINRAPCDFNLIFFCHQIVDGPTLMRAVVRPPATTTVRRS